jgi:hypothetical protein
VLAEPWLWGPRAYALPSTRLFGPKDAGDAKGYGDDVFPSTDLGPIALHFYEVAKLGAHVLGHILEASDLAIPET